MDSFDISQGKIWKAARGRDVSTIAKALEERGFTKEGAAQSASPQYRTLPDIILAVASQIHGMETNEAMFWEVIERIAPAIDIQKFTRTIFEAVIFSKHATQVPPTIKTAVINNEYANDIRQEIVELEYFEIQGLIYLVSTCNELDTRFNLPIIYCIRKNHIISDHAILTYAGLCPKGTEKRRESVVNALTEFLLNG